MADSQLQLGLDPRGVLEERVNRMLYAGEDRFAFTPEERGLLLVLKSHMGAARAIPIAALQERLHLSAREIKAAARGLVVRAGLPVIGSRQEPYGYYLSIDPRETAGARNVLLNEVAALVERLKALDESEDRITRRVRAIFAGGHKEGDAA